MVYFCKRIYFLSKTTDSDTNIYILTLYLQISICNFDQYKDYLLTAATSRLLEYHVICMYKFTYYLCASYKSLSGFC